MAKNGSETRQEAAARVLREAVMAVEVGKETEPSTPVGVGPQDPLMG